MQKQEIEALYQDLVDQINGEIALVKRRIEAEKVAEEQEKLRRLQVPSNCSYSLQGLSHELYLAFEDMHGQF